MEIQLKELIDTIKEEGFKTAKEDATQIIEQATSEASQIVLNAKEEAAKILQEAKEQIAKEEASSKTAIVQASRDVILNLKKEIEGLFSRLIENQVASSFNEQTLKDAIVDVVKGLAKDESDLTLLVNEKQLSSIESSLSSLLSNEIKNGLEIKPVDTIDCGFRVSLKNSSAFYDFSDKEVATVLSGFLNKKLAATIVSQIN